MQDGQICLPLKTVVLVVIFYCFLDAEKENDLVVIETSIAVHLGIDPIQWV